MRIELLCAIACLTLLTPTPNAMPEDAGDPTLVCSGPTCVADYAVFPAEGWVISSFEVDGTSLGEFCGPCLQCKAHVTWRYDDPNPYTVSWGSGLSTGTGPAQGGFRTENHCDGIPNSDVFSANTVTTNGMLLCPCVH